MTNKKKQTSPKFSGVLAEPIKQEWEPPKFDDAGSLLVAPSAGQIAQLQKLDALAEHYGAMIDGKTNFLLLTLRMAIEFVPGFKIEIKKPRGQPQTPVSKARDLNFLTKLEVLKRNGMPHTNAELARIVAAFEIDFDDKQAERRPRSGISRNRLIDEKAATIANRLSLPKLNNPLLRDMIARWCDLAEQGYTPEQRIRMLGVEADAILLEK
jgi:hypothetical protein